MLHLGLLVHQLPDQPPAPVTSSPATVTSSPVPLTSSPAPVTSSPAPVTSSPAPVTSSPAQTIITSRKSPGAPGPTGPVPDRSKL
ncbi:9410_t:CDS:2, partial [Cetraspora pellucida]